MTELLLTPYSNIIHVKEYIFSSKIHNVTLTGNIVTVHAELEIVMPLFQTDCLVCCTVTLTIPAPKFLLKPHVE
jgi:hypothetical protein